MRLERGLVHVITGNGPGKTTSALGKGMRAAGHGLKVYMIQFIKTGKWDKDDYGEIKFTKKLDNFKIVSSGKGFVKELTEEHLKAAKVGLTLAENVIREGKYDVVILDEINYALNSGLIDLSDIINLIKNKPEHVELILTGNNAPKELCDLADYVIEIKKIKHPLDRHLDARKGIEF